MKRDDWLDLARDVDWQFSYVDERELFPEEIAGRPWLPHADWDGWDEPFRTAFADYVKAQHAKEAALIAVRQAIGRVEDYERMDRGWLSALKLHSATFALAEFTAVVGNLRAARFGRDSAWRSTAALGALDELRHTQIPLALMHDLVRSDVQFDWTHRFLHTDDWVAIAARHLLDELLLASNPIEFAIGVNFVFETGFTNLQFVGLASMAHRAGDRMFEKMVQSIQTDEARHSQIGGPVLEVVLRHDPAYAQRLVDKWFWRTWQLFSVVTGFAMDYLTPLRARTASFKEFMTEWVLDQYCAKLDEVGLKRPWYWDTFVGALDHQHHMLYASAYTHRATLWFDLVLPGPDERAWLAEKYPSSWPLYDPVWQRVTDRWQTSGPGFEWYTHGLTPIAFCHLCQFVLCGGTPLHNTAVVIEHGGKRRVFCSEPCRKLFLDEPERYACHQDVTERILAGQAPGNLLELVEYFGLDSRSWGRDAARGRHGWIGKPEPQ